MKDTLFKGLVALAAGTVTAKVLKEVRARKLEKELYENVEVDEHSDKE